MKGWWTTLEPYDPLVHFPLEENDKVHLSEYFSTYDYLYRLVIDYILVYYFNRKIFTTKLAEFYFNKRKKADPKVKRIKLKSVLYNNCLKPLADRLTELSKESRQSTFLYLFVKYDKSHFILVKKNKNVIDAKEDLLNHNLIEKQYRLSLGNILEKDLLTHMTTDSICFIKPKLKELPIDYIRFDNVYMSSDYVAMTEYKMHYSQISNERDFDDIIKGWSGIYILGASFGLGKRVLLKEIARRMTIDKESSFLPIYCMLNNIDNCLNINSLSTHIQDKLNIYNINDVFIDQYIFQSFIKSFYDKKKLAIFINYNDQPIFVKIEKYLENLNEFIQSFKDNCPIMIIDNIGFHLRDISFDLWDFKRLLKGSIRKLQIDPPTDDDINEYLLKSGIKSDLHAIRIIEAIKKIKMVRIVDKKYEIWSFSNLKKPIQLYPMYRYLKTWRVLGMINYLHKENCLKEIGNINDLFLIFYKMSNNLYWCVEAIDNIKF